jgi:hypothetical protein
MLLLAFAVLLLAYLAGIGWTLRWVLGVVFGA